MKHSASLEYYKVDFGQMSRFTAELAVPLLGYERSPSFLKLEGSRQHRFPIVDDKINLVCEVKAGKILPLSSNKNKASSFANDRLYLYLSSGYLMLGHSEPTLRPTAEKTEEDDKQKRKDVQQVVLGDDLGSDTFLYTGARLDYCNMPYLKDSNVRLYSSAEAVYYPPFNKPSSNPIHDVRASLGFGMHFRLNEMINIGLHYNAANFNTKVGDIERQAYINFQLSMF